MVHLRFRRLSRANGPFRMWGYPWTSYLAFVLAVTIASSALLVPTQRIGLVGLMVLFGFYGLVYQLKIKKKYA